MTMQLAISCKGGAFVLASDMLNREIPEGGTVYVPSYWTKVAFCERHQIAVAMSGSAGFSLKPQIDFAGYLSARQGIPIVKVEAQEWAHEYSSDNRGALEGCSATLLIVNPKDRLGPLVKLYIAQGAVRDLEYGYFAAGNDGISAMFWPDYFRPEPPERDLDLRTATAVAALTVLTAAKINPYSIGRIQVWQYRDGWRELSHNEIREHVAWLLGRFEGDVTAMISDSNSGTDVDKSKFDNLLRKMIATPPTPHSETKVGKPRRSRG